MANWWATNWHNPSGQTVFVSNVEVTVTDNSFDVELPEDDVIELQAGVSVDLTDPALDVSITPSYDVEED